MMMPLSEMDAGELGRVLGTIVWTLAAVVYVWGRISKANKQNRGE